jgi:peptide/nickel transport system permease protein
MTAYLIRRLLYTLPILVGVNLFTFLLFFVVNPPKDMATAILGEKNTTDEDIRNWLRERNYHLPRLYHAGAAGWGKLTQTIFFQKTVPLFFFQFGRSDRNNIWIGREIRRRMLPSLSIAVPTFALGLLASVTCAMFLAFYRGTAIDYGGLILCVVMMSTALLFYIIGGQYLFGRVLRVFPISGFDPNPAGLWKFAALPVLVGTISGVGSTMRFDRTLFLEEIYKDYVRTARAKGLSERTVLFKHALKNAMIPILTSVVLTIPLLFMGSLLMESFFTIPGLGSFTLDAINQQDFAIVRSMVFLGSALYIVGLLLTDLCYTLVDPRVTFK